MQIRFGILTAVTEMAMLSRLTSGIKEKTLIINFPGSTKASVECFGFIKACLPHAVALLQERDSEVKAEHMRIQGENPSAESKVKIQTGASRMRKSPYPLLEVEEAFALVLKTVIPRNEIEEIPIEDALDRILAESIKASRPIPPFPASMKDGYACRAADGGGMKLVRSSAAAGDVPCVEPLRPGEVIRISTGAAIPAGADAVVQVEDTTLVAVTENGEDETSINVNVTPKVGQDIRQIGSDVQADALVLQKCTRITPAYIGVLAMLGLNKVKVNRRPQIGIISTGNELVPPKGPLQPGLIYDSNKVTLLTLLKKYGYEAKDCGIARDTPNSVKSILERAFDCNDFIVSSGGVSMSEYDLLKQVLVEDFNAIIHFGRVNMKPGKPTVFATLTYKEKMKVIFALPGNPVSCCVTSILFVIPTLRHLENYKAFSEWPKIKILLEQDVNNNDPRPEYVRLKVSRNCENKLIGVSTGNQISSRLNSMVDANALMVVPGKTVIQKGEVVTCTLFDQIA
ncbi:gephyrin isoform X2 [Anthonomus grandis grandis]|uniref:gephyrin isoform X2 n=1 Tax=Anthonomus grandis grandis TaxID=2921223 RepID=UPI0021651344|nr:gephyrin isoform X2 [Anthonomus grandis grandis]XP_050315481.1 gephyrin isoform X2 [Anthonomus grandis grandis]